MNNLKQTDRIPGTAFIERVLGDGVNELHLKWRQLLSVGNHLFLVPGREPAELAEHVTGLPTDTSQFHTVVV